MLLLVSVVDRRDIYNSYCVEHMAQRLGGYRANVAEYGYFENSEWLNTACQTQNTSRSCVVSLSQSQFCQDEESYLLQECKMSRF